MSSETKSEANLINYNRLEQYVEDYVEEVSDKIIDSTDADPDLVSNEAEMVELIMKDHAENDAERIASMLEKSIKKDIEERLNSILDGENRIDFPEKEVSEENETPVEVKDRSISNEELLIRRPGVSKRWGVIKSRHEGLELTLIGQNGSLHKQTKYVASQTGYASVHGLEPIIASNARSELRKHGFEIEDKELVTELPRGMDEDLTATLDLYGWPGDGFEQEPPAEQEKADNGPYSGQKYWFENRSLVLDMDEQEYNIPVWDDKGLTPEAELIAYAVTEDLDYIEMDDGYLSPEHYNAFKELNDMGVLSGDDRRLDRTEYSVELEEDFEENFSKVVNRTKNKVIRTGRVETCDNNEIGVGYGPGHVVVKRPDDVELDLQDTVVVELSEDYETGARLIA